MNESLIAVFLLGAAIGLLLLLGACALWLVIYICVRLAREYLAAIRKLSGRE
jgi:hypothetical protein